MVKDLVRQTVRADLFMEVLDTVDLAVVGLAMV